MNASDRWFGEFAVAELPVDRSLLTAPVLVGELCAVLDEGAAGLIVDLPGAGACDAAGLDGRGRTWPGIAGWRLSALDGVSPAGL